MIATFKGKKITGMLTVMPENEYDYDEETKEEEIFELLVKKGKFLF